MARQLTNGRPMIDIVIPNIGYLASKEAIDEHNARVDRDYHGWRTLKPFGYDSKAKEVKGSNIHGTALLLQKTLSQEGYRLVTLQDLENARNLNQANPSLGLNTQGYCYTDLGIVVRSETDKTRHIVEQIRKVNPKLAKLTEPVAILLSGIEPVVGGPIDGLRYNLLESAVMYSAPEHAGQNKNFLAVKSNRPVVGTGNRTIWNNSGLDLSRLFLNGSLNLYSNYEYLAWSDGNGRVVLVSGEVTAPDLVRKYQEERNANFKTLMDRLGNKHSAEMSKLASLAEELGVSQ